MQATRKRRSRYAKLPRHARLLVHVLEILFPTCKYADGNKYPSRIMRAAVQVLTPGSEESIKAGKKPGEYYVKSESRPKFNRWYAVSLKDLTCEVDVSRLQMPKNLQVRDDMFHCEDFKKTELCFHILVAAIVEAVRVDSLEFQEED